MHGDAGRDPYRRRAFGGILGAQQVVGEAPRGRAVTDHRQGIGQPGRERRRTGFGSGAVEPGGLAGITSTERRSGRQLVGQPAVPQAVFGQP